MKIKKILAVVLALTVTFAFTACKKDPEYDYVDRTVTINVSEAPLFIGDTLDLSITTEYVSDDTDFIWTSTKSGVASVVTAEGTRAAVVTAKAAGTATINVRIGGRTKAKCVVTVSKIPEKLTFSLPAGRLVLGETGDRATVRVAVVDTEIPQSSVSWKSADERIAKVEAQGLLGVITAVAEGETDIIVSGDKGGETVEARLSVKVLMTAYIPGEEPTRTYNVYKANGQKSPTVYKGLSSALNEVMYGAGYGPDSYLTFEDEDEIIYTFEGKNYNFFTRSSLYKGFDAITDKVVNGQSGYWNGWQTDLNIYNREFINMFQYGGSCNRSWYYRSSKQLHNPGATAINNASGYVASIYQAAGAGLNYATWADDRGYWFNDVELNYDLSQSRITPSQSSQSVFAEIYMRPVITAVSNFARNQNYYGAYFDAGTVESTNNLADGATRNWYAYKGEMAFSASESRVYPLASHLSVDTSAPIGTATWNKSEGCWETADLSIKLETKYKYSDENSNADFEMEFTITGSQGSTTLDKTYIETAAAGKKINRNGAEIRFTYGASFTPNAAVKTAHVAGETVVADLTNFYKFDAVPDIYNGASWTDLRQGTCRGSGVVGTNVRPNETAGTPVSRDISVKSGDAIQYATIWGSDVLTHAKASSYTSFSWHF